MQELVSEKLVGELRERMGDILAAVQLLTPLVEEKGEERDRGYLAVMNKSLYRLVRTIHHLETCAGKYGYEPAPLDLAGMCRDLCRSCEYPAEILGVSFDWSLGESGLVALGDEHLLELALLNLLSNAFEAAGRGGHVTLKEESGNGRWTVTIRDDGKGLRQEKKPEDPFLKTAGGVGLGLEAARKAIELHDGVLVLENREGHGVRAVVSLPLRKPEGNYEKENHLLQELGRDYRGGFSPLLVEFSPLLPAENFSIEDLE